MCRWVFRLFVLLYLVAFGLFLVGNLGLFGSDSGPLAGIFLIPLGLPWNLLLDSFSGDGLARIGLLAPLANIILLGAACRWLNVRR